MTTRGITLLAELRECCSHHDRLASPDQAQRWRGSRIRLRHHGLRRNIFTSVTNRPWTAKYDLYCSSSSRRASYPKDSLDSTDSSLISSDTRPVIVDFPGQSASLPSMSQGYSRRSGYRL